MQTNRTYNKQNNNNKYQETSIANTYVQQTKPQHTKNNTHKKTTTHKTRHQTKTEQQQDNKQPTTGIHTHKRTTPNQNTTNKT